MRVVVPNTMNIQISASTSTTSNEMDETNASIRPSSPRPENKRRKEHKYAPSESLRTHAVTGEHATESRL